MKNCTRCSLHKTRKNIVFPSGPANAKLIFIGEAPGADEDEAGKPFIGRAGKILTKLIEEEGLRREDVYITNIVRCRPPNNRRPKAEEIKQCKSFLFDSIKEVKPKIVCPLGSTSSQFLLETKDSISLLRGKSYPSADNTYLIMPTYHPSFLLPERKKLFRQDIRAIIKKLNS